jgi:hypothetical protein
MLLLRLNAFSGGYDAELVGQHDYGFNNILVADVVFHPVDEAAIDF